jgi:hypothetical protein
VKVGKPVEHIALSPDGSVVVISYEGQLHFYAAADGSPIDSVPRAHYGPSLSRDHTHTTHTHTPYMVRMRADVG